MMNPFVGMLTALAFLSLTACSSSGGSLALGALGGAAACAGWYELHLKNQKDQVEKDFKDGKIDQKERDIRINQIERDSLLQ